MLRIQPLFIRQHPPRPDPRRHAFAQWTWNPDVVHTRPGPVRWFAQIGEMVAHGFREHRCGWMATSLTFITLLSIVPVLALAFTASQSFTDQIRPWIEREFGGSEYLRKSLDWILNAAADTDVTALGGFGTLLLLFLVLRTVGTIERSFNIIWEVDRDRRWVRKFTDYLSLIVIGPLCLIGIASATGFELGTASESTIPLPFELGLVSGTQIISLVVVWLAFALQYILVPNKRVRLRAAIAGGIIGGSLWKLALTAYVALQVGVGQNAAIYGAFAALPIFLIWVHVSWVIVLIGAEIGAAIENRARFRDEMLAQSVSRRGRLALALRLLVIAARRQHAGDPPLTIREYAHELGAPYDSIRNTVTRLAKPGFVAPRTALSAPVVLAVAPEHIAIGAVVDAFELQTRRIPEGPDTDAEADRSVRDLLDDVDHATERALGARTIRDLVEGENGSGGPEGAGVENRPDDARNIT